MGGGGWVATQTAGAPLGPAGRPVRRRSRAPRTGSGTPAGALLGVGAAAARRAAVRVDGAGGGMVRPGGGSPGRRVSRGGHAGEVRGTAPRAPTVASVGARHDHHCRNVDGGWRMTATRGVVERLRERTPGGRVTSGWSAPAEGRGGRGAGPGGGTAHTGATPQRSRCRWYPLTMTTTRDLIGWRPGHGRNIAESASCQTESAPQNLPKMPADRRLHPHRLDGSRRLTPSARRKDRSPARSTSDLT